MNNLKKSMIAGIILLVILLLANFSIKLFMLAGFWASRIYFWIVLIVMVFYALKVEKQKYLLYEEQKYHLKKALLMALVVNWH